MIFRLTKGRPQYRRGWFTGEKVVHDDFFRYEQFKTEKLKSTMFGWDGLIGGHGLIIKKAAELIPEGSTVLDVGCGLCHLYEATKDKIKNYVGVDVEPRVLKWARERFPDLKFHHAHAYDLTGTGTHDVVCGIGLYATEPQKQQGIIEMLKHARKKVIITYKQASKEPTFLPNGGWKEYNIIPSKILDDNFVFLEIYK